jgi:RNA polymerase sigma-70 factor (ECF subfamily)
MEYTDHDIKVLITKSAGGDAESCKKLYEHLVDKVFAYVRSRTSTQEHATDITQDVFIDFFSTLSNFTYQTRAQLYAYVFVITKRKLARLYQYAHTHGENTKTTFDEEVMSPHTENTPNTSTYDVAQALSHLDEETREIVILHHWSRYTFKEIAELLGMTESAVRVRHHRALPQLATYLQQ